MNRWIAGCVGCCVFAMMNGFAGEVEDVDLPGGGKAVFASRDVGRELLVKEDEFLHSMGSLDRQVRMKKTNVAEAEWKEHLRGAAAEWQSDERATVVAALKSFAPMIGTLHLKLPPEVLLVKTTGAEEGGFPYTRGHAIFLPEKVVKGSAGNLSHLIAHELSHVMTRANPRLRDKLYAALGFSRLPAPLAYPAFLEPRRITNPDAPVIEHAIKVRHAGREITAAMLISLPSDHFDEKTGGPSFDDIEVHLVPVDMRTGKAVAESKADLLDLADVSGLTEQVGRNTGYLIHPEEILADNVALLLLGQKKVPSPEILESLRKVLAADGP